MSTLLIKECTVDDEGDYEVVISNVAGEASHMFETIVYAEKPVIVQALPDNVNVILHQPAMLAVKFDSPMETKVSWMANGVTLEDSVKYQITTTENETSLRVADTIKDDAEMVYTCRVKNIAGHTETACSLTTICKLVVLVANKLTFVNFYCVIFVKMLMVCSNYL